MNVVQTVAPTIEPISLAEAKLHLRLDSGSFADSIDETNSIAPGLKAFINDWTTHAGSSVDVLGYTSVASLAVGVLVATSTVDVKIQESDDNVTFNDWTGGSFTQITTDGVLTTAALAIGTTLTNVANGLFTYFIAGTAYSKPADAAGTAPGNDVIPMGKYGAVAFDIGADNTIDYIEAAGNAGGYATAALATAGLAAPGAGHVRIGSVTATKSDGAFTFGTTELNAVNSTVAYTQGTLTANYNATYEKAYTGTKRYIKTVAKVLVANASFGTTIIRQGATGYEDSWLTDAIAEAREFVEGETNRALLTQTWKLYLDGFPDSDRIRIPFGNLQTVTSIKYKDSDYPTSAEVTMTLATDYLVETNGPQCGYIILPYGKYWPTDILYPSNPITIEFVCGWTTAALVPRNLRAMVKLYLAAKYEHRGDNVVGQMVNEDKQYDRLKYHDILWDGVF